MEIYPFKKILVLFILPAVVSVNANSQSNYPLKYKQSQIYAGIEVGSKGVKMSLLEVGKNAQKETRFNILKDTSVNTDFISFTPQTFNATLNALTGLYNFAISENALPSEKVYTVISSGIKVQSEKEGKTDWPLRLADSFRVRISEPGRQVEIIDPLQEARLSHLGIVPEERRFNTFLIDIGSGNTKGGYFPNGNTKEFKLFQLTWGTKSTANATEKRLGDDKTVENFNRNLYRVLSGNAADEIVYAVNVSNAYNMNDYVAFSGGIAWATASLMFPELAENPVVPVTYEELFKFRERILKNHASLADDQVAAGLGDDYTKAIAQQEAKRANQVFDQRSLLAGTGLLINIMRQFEGVYERKQFYLVKNGQVGWISAYVNQSLQNK